MKKKKAPNRNPITFAKVVLRGASRKWYAGNEVFKRCRVSRGVYVCEGCQNVTPKKNLQIDHIDPVVDIKTGFQTLDEWVMRLYVSPEKLQALCNYKVVNENTGKEENHGCHATKTALENEMRDYYKKKKKVTKKRK